MIPQTIARAVPIMPTTVFMAYSQTPGPIAEGYIVADFLPLSTRFYSISSRIDG